MKTLFLAAAAIASLAAVSAPAMAATTVIKTGPHRTVIVKHPARHHLRRVVIFRHGHRAVVYR